MDTYAAHLSVWLRDFISNDFLPEMLSLKLVCRFHAVKRK